MKALMLAILLATILCAAPLQAAPAASTGRVEFKDTLGTVINAVDGKYNIGLGQNFTADVYLTSSVDWNEATQAFGWGTASSQGGTDLSADFTVNTYKAFNGNTFSSWAHYTGGFTNADLQPLSYGDYYRVLGAGETTLTANTEYRVATYKFTNMMANGKTGTIGLYNIGGTTTDDQRSTAIYTYDGMTSYYLSTPPTIYYSMNSIPEPSSMMAMGCAGVGVLGDLLRRRRKRSSAKK